jgi:peptide/nickel transport system substrate-binding protein
MKFRTAALLLLVLLLAFSAVPMKAQGGKAITVSWLQEPDSLNPMYTTMTFAGYTYQLYLVGAWTLDDSLNPVPLLVEEIPTQENGGISEDGSTFTLKLREGMVWSDGDPLDSADFVFTHEMVMSDQNSVLSTSPWDRMLSVEAPDATTVVVTFPGPYAPWLGLFQWVLPEHVLRPVFEAEGSLDNAEFNRAPSVANGPYILDEWSAGNFARFTKNENFVGGVANIDTIVVTFVPDDNTYVANLLSGDAEIGTFIAPSDVAGLEAAGMRIDVLGSGYSEGWFLNFDPELAHPAMQDRNVRQALAIGWDRATAISDLLVGVLPPSSGYWHDTPLRQPRHWPAGIRPGARRRPAG